MNITYYIFKNGEQQGPFTDDVVRQALQAGTLAHSDLVWQEGWKEWKELGAVFGTPNIDPPPILPTTQKAPSTTSRARTAASLSGGPKRWSTVLAMTAAITFLGPCYIIFNYASQSAERATVSTVCQSAAKHRETNIRKIATTGNGVIALMNNGTIVGWGEDAALKDLPKNLCDAEDIAASESGACLVLRKNGTVLASGNNKFGECDFPQDLADVVSIAAGSSYTQRALTNNISDARF